MGRLGHAQVQKRHAPKTQPRRQLARILHQFGAALDAVNMPAGPRLEKQVVQNEAQVGFARAMVGQGDAAGRLTQRQQQWLDELEQVVDLLEFATRVLVELALPGEDVQRLQQFDRLAWPDLGRQVGGCQWLLRVARPDSAFGLLVFHQRLSGQSRFIPAGPGQAWPRRTRQARSRSGRCAGKCRQHRDRCEVLG